MLLDKLTNESPDEQSVLLLVLFTQCLSQKRNILLLHSTLHDINYLMICQTSNHWNFSLKITFREWHSRFQTALIGLCVGRGGGSDQTPPAAPASSWASITPGMKDREWEEKPSREKKPSKTVELQSHCLTGAVERRSFVDSAFSSGCLDCTVEN